MNKNSILIVVKTDEDKKMLRISVPKENDSIVLSHTLILKMEHAYFRDKNNMTKLDPLVSKLLGDYKLKEEEIIHAIDNHQEMKLEVEIMTDDIILSDFVSNTLGSLDTEIGRMNWLFNQRNITFSSLKNPFTVAYPERQNAFQNFSFIKEKDIKDDNNIKEYLNKRRQLGLAIRKESLLVYKYADLIKPEHNVSCWEDFSKFAHLDDSHPSCIEQDMNIKKFLVEAKKETHLLTDFNLTEIAKANKDKMVEFEETYYQERIIITPENTEAISIAIEDGDISLNGINHESMNFLDSEFFYAGNLRDEYFLEIGRLKIDGVEHISVSPQHISTFVSNKAKETLPVPKLNTSTHVEYIGATASGVAILNEEAKQYPISTTIEMMPLSAIGVNKEDDIIVRKYMSMDEELDEYEVIDKGSFIIAIASDSKEIDNGFPQVFKPNEYGNPISYDDAVSITMSDNELFKRLELSASQAHKIKIDKSTLSVNDDKEALLGKLGFPTRSYITKAIFNNNQPTKGTKPTRQGIPNVSL